MIRRVCALVAVFVVVLQASSGGHLLLVEHTRCAEHGELIHDAGGHTRALRGHLRAHGPALHGLPDGGSDRSHGHCALDGERRDASIAIVASHISTHVCEATEVGVLVSARTVRGAALFLIAPKSSPPA